jgi:hypothetical protein
MGTIFSDEDELLLFFSEGEAAKIVNKNRSLNSSRECKPILSEMTIPLLIREHAL